MAEQNFFQFSEVIADGSTEKHMIECDRAMSKLNRKQYHQVDSKGNAQVYLIRIRQYGYTAADNAELSTTVLTAPNNYVTKSAVKAFHRARIKMLERQGISLKQLSPYTRHLHVAWDSDTGNTPAANAELYTNDVDDSKFVVESQLDESDTTALTSALMVDQYTCTLLGDHIVSSSSGEPTKYTTVGVNKAWLDARRTPPSVNDETSTDVTTIDHETNPLYELLSGSGIAEELSEAVQDDQIAKPPWTNPVNYAPMASGYLFTAVNSGVSECVVEAPLGMLQLNISDLRSTNDCTARFTFEVLDIYDM